MGMQKLVHFSVSAMLLEVCVFFFWFIYLYVLGKCYFEVLSVLCEWCGRVEWAVLWIVELMLQSLV